MTTLELFKKHRKGEVSRERFLYEVRRDNNLPWITNTTSYNDAVKILKNKGIVRESVENVATDPAVDRVNPYFLKRGVNKILDGEKELTNDSYINAVNKAAKQLQANPHAFDKEMFANADTVEKADAKLEMTPVKKNNFVDKDNGMKKVKGQEVLKAQSAPTKENKKGKPKGVKVMPDKGVEGSQKIIKEIADFIKKKLTENTYHDFTLHQSVPTPHGNGTIEDIDGGTLVVQCEDGKLYDVQMNVVTELMKKAQEEAEQPKNEGYEKSNVFDNLEDAKKYAEEESANGYVQHVQDKGTHFVVDDWYDSDETVASYENGMELNEEYDAEQNQPDYYINVSLRDASRAIEIYRDLNNIPQGSVKMDGTDSYVIDDLEIAQELLDAFQEQGVEIIDTDVPPTDSYEDELDEDSAKTATLRKAADQARLQYLQSQADDIKKGMQSP